MMKKAKPHTPWSRSLKAHDRKESERYEKVLGELPALGFSVKQATTLLVEICGMLPMPNPTGGSGYLGEPPSKEDRKRMDLECIEHDRWDEAVITAAIGLRLAIEHSRKNETPSRGPVGPGQYEMKLAALVKAGKMSQAKMERILDDLGTGRYDRLCREAEQRHRKKKKLKPSS